MIKRLGLALVAVVVLGVVLSACSSSHSGVSAPAGKPFYVSLGDSYSVGYQPGPGNGSATSGYTAVVAKGMGMQLANFGCGGATTLSILVDKGCTQSGFGPVAATDAVAYPKTTQVQAAVHFIRMSDHRGKVGLVTLSIGGNDVTSCVKQGSEAAILSCVNNADSSIARNVYGAVGLLRAALKSSGDHAKVIGLTYPDVILGEWVYPQSSPNQSLASVSVTAFDKLINPALERAYGPKNFVNVTVAPYGAATQGANTPLTTTVTLAPYGQIPAAVGEICELTYYCTQGNIHANSTGYNFIGQQILAHLK